MTFIDEKNYGNRLQNFAVQEFLKEQGFEVETIRNDKFYDYYLVDDSLKRQIGVTLKRIIFGIYRFIDKSDSLQGYEITFDHRMRKRICLNKQFTCENIKQSKIMLREGDDYCEKLSDYKYIFIGSDQVWNPLMAGASEFFFLPKIESEKKIVFAASIGLDAIPDEYRQQWNYYLSTLCKISVREQSAIEILKESRKEAIKILDPTFLLERSEYDILAAKSRCDVKSKYVATYLLGDRNSEYAGKIKKFATEYGLDIIDINDTKNTFSVYDFLKIIKHAEVIITDSFHACVFSIIFLKEFYVVKRVGEFENIYSRIKDLLETFAIEGRDINRIEDIVTRKNVKLCEQYDTVDKIIKENKEKTLKFLNDSCQEIL